MELISKEDVIKALQKWNCRDYDSLTINPYEVLRDIPTIEERKEGEWIYEECNRLVDETDWEQIYATEKRWYCSRCGFSKGFMMYRPDEKYCPNCGARMKGVGDDKKCHKPPSAYYRAYCEERKEKTYCEGCKFWY